MEILLILAVLAVGGYVFTAFIVVPAISSRPDNLGVTDGQLSACPRSPNCVHSQQDTMVGPAMSPILYTGTTADALTRLRMVIDAIGGGTVVTQTDDYLHVEFRSAMLRFVDDVEFYLVPEGETGGVIHFRSGARLGYGDMGVNKSRMETISQRFSAGG